MTRTPWTSNDQKDWLESHKTEYLAANINKTATKVFFPEIFKAFREKWPVPDVTQDEIDKADGSIELATKIKRSKYDKRIREWYHNNKRQLNSVNSGGGTSLLKVAAPRKMLHGWQAYQALTYESQWKMEVDRVWKDYKNEWESDHPGEDPPKGRFAIMNEFLREKYQNESEEMKARCEEYRKALKEEKMAPSESFQTRNLQFETAIKKLPHTLSTIGKSLMAQTGWNITIMAGGPSPSNEGAIMTFLSHTGKTKDDEDFEGFLGPRSYDQHILIPFDKFLDKAFSVEDRESRILKKSKIDDSSMDFEEEEDSKMDVDNEEESNDAGERDESADDAVEQKVKKARGPSEYAKKRQRNIEENKKILAQLMKTHPIGEKGRDKGVVTPRNKDVTDKALSVTSDSSPALSISSIQITLEPEQSTRPDNDPMALPLPDESGTLSITPHHGNHEPSSHHRLPNSSKNSVEPANKAAALPLPDESCSLSITPHHGNHEPSSHHRLPDSSKNSVEPANKAAARPLPDESGSLSITPHHGNHEPSSHHRLPDSSKNSVDPSKNSVEPANEAAQHGNTFPNNPAVEPANKTPHHGVHDQSAVTVQQTRQEGPPKNTVQPGGDPPPPANIPPLPSPRDVKNDDVPPWLVPMIGYLRGLTEDGAWQNLVTNFLAFERFQPPCGNLATKKRPQEISNWIKSKKKNVVPSVNAGAYGKRFLDWWRLMQPSWRIDGDLFVRSAPQGETWEGLRKGGTAGIYVVIVGLSWWIKSQIMERDPNAWTAVHDISWVIQEMNGSSCSALKTQKRGLEGKENEAQPKKIRRLSK